MTEKVAFLILYSEDLVLLCNILYKYLITHQEQNRHTDVLHVVKELAALLHCYNIAVLL